MLGILAHDTKKQHNIYTQIEHYMVSLTSNADLKLASLSLR